MDLDDISLKNGSAIETSTKAKISEINESNIDSPTNCVINCSLNAPTVLRNPTSFALVPDSAVARFIKLMQAMKIINTATNRNIRTYWKLP